MSGKFINANLFKSLLSFILLTVIYSAASAQEPKNFVGPVRTKTYSKLPNPLIKTTQPVKVSIINGEAYLDGDIALGSEEYLDRFQNMSFSIRGDASLINARWENGIVPFVISDGFSEAEKQIIIDAMNHIAQNTHVSFRHRTNQGNYIKFKKYSVSGLGFSGGSSYLGRCMFCTDGQEIKLSSVSSSVVRHETGHALGLHHEQTREDRDEFVEILWNNIEPGMEAQFAQHVYDATDVGNYDFSSIMHYGPRSFGKVVGGAQLQTIRRRSNPSNTNFGSASVLSSGDISGINSMYQTEQAFTTLTLLAPGELEVGQVKNVDIFAKETYNFPHIFMRKDQKFKFTVSSDDMWKNGGTESNANGYEGSLFDAARRHNDLKMMALVGEIFSKNNDALSYTGTYFKIGTSKTWTATKTGFFMGMANDCLGCYGDNSKKVTVKIERVE